MVTFLAFSTHGLRIIPKDDFQKVRILVLSSFLQAAVVIAGQEYRVAVCIGDHPIMQHCYNVPAGG